METPADYERPSRTIWRLRLAARDFENAAKFIGAAGKHDMASLEHEALLECALIRYARPFSGNERRADAKADSRLMPEVVDPARVLGEDFALHTRVLNLRNTVVAHSEAERNPVAVMPPAEGTGGKHAAGFVSRRWHIVNEQLDLEAFARIADLMRAKCMNKLADFTRTGTVAGVHA